MNRRRLMLALLLAPPLAAALSLAFRTSALVSVLLFLGVPSVVASIGLSWRMIRKLVLFSLVIAPAAIIPIDYIAELNGTWQFFHSSVFPFKLLSGLVPMEVIIWAFLNIYAVVAYYERFFDRDRRVRPFEPRIRYLIALVASLVLLFVAAYVRTEGAIRFPYFYAAFGTVLILVPIVAYLARRPALAGKFFLTGSYFFYLCLTYEVTALRLGQWYFPAADFIGWVSLLGVRFPLEEFVFWLMLLAPATLAYYEYFDDDSR